MIRACSTKLACRGAACLLTAVVSKSRRRSRVSRSLNGPVLRDIARLSQHGQLGAIPPPPFLSISQLESMRSGSAIPPPPHKKGISAILARYPVKARQNACDTPSAILSRKGIARYGGGGINRIGPLRSQCSSELSRRLWGVQI